MRRLLFSISILVFLFPIIYVFGNKGSDYHKPTGGLLITREVDLDTLSNEGRDVLMKKVMIEIGESDIVVTNKKQCITGNKHNYESLSSYYWPDPNNPRGPYINKDGYVNPETLDYDREKIDKLAQRCTLFSKAYYYTKDRKFYRAFVRQIDAWFVNKKTKMNPDMRYSQIIKRKYHNQGQAHGIIDAYAFSRVLESVRLVEEVKPLPRSSSMELKKWFKNFSTWLKSSEQGKIESKQPNNHCPYYYSLLTNISIYIDDKQFVEEIIRNYPNVVLHRLIKVDGRQPGELIRTRAFHYSNLTLSAILDFCYMMERCGVNFYGDNKVIIDKGFSFLLQYVDKQDAFPGQEIGDWNYEVTFLNSLTNRLKSLETNTSN